MELTQKALIEAALARGIEVDTLPDCATSYIELTFGDQHILFSDCGVPQHWINYQAFVTAENKQYCKRLFERVGIPFPKSLVFEDFESSKTQLASFMQPSQRYVCKPLDGMEGKGVCMQLETLDDVKTAWERWNNQYHHFMLEEQKAGADLRLQAIDGKLVAACSREPAFVIGDGVQNIEALAHLVDQKVRAQNPINTLTLDQGSLDCLAAQGLTPASIPQKGEKIAVKYLANMNQGAISTDITDLIHPTYHQWIANLSEALQLSIFALDVLTLDYQQAPSADNTWAIEVNGNPYWYHHTFSERRTHDMANLILDAVFGAAVPA